MLDIEDLPAFIVEDIKKRGFSTDDIAKLTPESAFNEYCNWHGLNGWGSSLIEVYTELKDAECGDSA